MKKKLIYGIFFGIYLFSGSDAFCQVENRKLKYGPKGTPYATPLAQSNEYFRRQGNSAPAFWALISYYIPQFTHASCSSATLAMTLNAARADLPKDASDAVITEQTLLDQIKVDHWKERLTEKGYLGQYGANLDLLGKITPEAFKHFGFPDVQVQVIHMQKGSSHLKTELIQNLKKLSKKTWIMANFDQRYFTDDTQVGHFAPVGAFDEENRRVLILDPDREYYEPYWVSLETFQAGMETTDSSGKKPRGYILVQTNQ